MLWLIINNNIINFNTSLPHFLNKKNVSFDKDFLKETSSLLSVARLSLPESHYS